MSQSLFWLFRISQYIIVKLAAGELILTSSTFSVYIGS